MESSISETVGKALSLSSEVSGRFFSGGLGYTVIYMIGWLIVAYLIYLLIMIYILPAISGQNYYYVRPWGRSVPMGGPHFYNPTNMRMGPGGFAALNEDEATHLTATVTRAVANPGRK
ncbi:unnamed protein product [Allacma fusca]|uniref:Uncharacterized protein n=1 Tax=Allacma fusca TaxID=39272 RepID=A0A8J2NSV9_9HEXA|nr:unnamed protein product [Allacma fusca]